MADPTSLELFTFTTSSKGGLSALGELCKTYGKMMRQRPDHIPTVKLGFGSYKPRDPARSRVKFPIFDIVDWTDKQPYLDLLERGPNGEPENALGIRQGDFGEHKANFNAVKPADVRTLVPRF